MKQQLYEMRSELLVAYECKGDNSQEQHQEHRRERLDEVAVAMRYEKEDFGYMYTCSCLLHFLFVVIALISLFLVLNFY